VRARALGRRAWPLVLLAAIASPALGWAGLFSVMIASRAF
jgi:hypothetical protein